MKHQQAHLPRRVKKSYGGLPISIKEQMEYYMGAKLLEVGVDPQEPFYSWSCEEEGEDYVWTYSAYWGDLKEEKMREKAAKKAAKQAQSGENVSSVGSTNATQTGAGSSTAVATPEPKPADTPPKPKRKFWNLFG